MKDLLGRAREKGFIISRSKRGGHIKILRADGTFLTACSISPSDNRSVINLVLEIRRMTGVDLRRE